MCFLQRVARCQRGRFQMGKQPLELEVRQRGQQLIRLRVTRIGHLEAPGVIS